MSLQQVQEVALAKRTAEASTPLKPEREESGGEGEEEEEAWG